MNSLFIIGILILLAIIVIVVYFIYDSSEIIYTTTFKGTTLYQGLAQPFVTSDDFARIVIAHGNKVDIFTDSGTKLGTVTVVGVTFIGAAYNSADDVFMVITSDKNLYGIDEDTLTAIMIGVNYTKLYDTVDGYYAVTDAIEIVSGATKSREAVNGSYGSFDVLTKISH